MKTSSDIKKIVDKDLHIEVLRDTLEDMRVENRFIRKLVGLLLGLILLLAVGMFSQGIYYQHKTFKFMQDFEVVSDVNMSNADSYNNGNITIERK